MRLQTFAPDRSNVLGIHSGSGGGHSLMLNGHFKTDPADIVDPFPGAKVIDGEWLSGVGMWNMKSQLAVYVAAISAIRKSGIALSGDVLISGTAGAWDESPVDTQLKGERIEGFSVGMKHQLSRGAIPGFAVVGEPTSFKIVREQFGRTLARIDLYSDAPPGPSVVDDFTGDPRGRFTPARVGEHIAIVINAINAWAPEYVQRHIVNKVRPWAQISGIEGGTAGQGGAIASAGIYIHADTPPGVPATLVLDELQKVIGEVRQRHPDIRAHAELYSVTFGAAISADHPFISSLRTAHHTVFGRTPEEAPVVWNSDALPLFQHGTAVVNYGPTGMIKRSPAGVPAGTGEFVRIDDFLAYTRVLIALIVDVCADPKR